MHYHPPSKNIGECIPRDVAYALDTQPKKKLGQSDLESGKIRKDNFNVIRDYYLEKQ